MKTKKIKCVLLVFFVLLIVVLGLFIKNTHSLPDFIVDSDIIYVPDRISNKKTHQASIDIMEMWSFDLKKQEIEHIESEIDSGKLKKMNHEHIDFLDNTGWEKHIINKIQDIDQCWICIYDVSDNSYVTDLNNISLQWWCVFLYDECTKTYYCILQTT